jgi:hypothetical protein
MIVGFLAPGDRSHIPDSVRPAYNIISGQLNQLKQTSPVCDPRVLPSFFGLSDWVL